MPGSWWPPCRRSRVDQAPPSRCCAWAGCRARTVAKVATVAVARLKKPKPKGCAAAPAASLRLRSSLLKTRAALQLENQLPRQPSMRNFCLPPVAAAPARQAVQVGAFQAKPPVVALAVAQHHLVCKPLCLVNVNALECQPLQLHQATINLPRVHRRAVRPTPSIRVIRLF